MAGYAAGDESRSKIATVLRVTSGNFLEMFDFFLFGFYATYISRSFFPAGSEFASLMVCSPCNGTDLWGKRHNSESIPITSFAKLKCEGGRRCI